jgi:sugar lactone lactonase YvrE
MLIHPFIRRRSLLTALLMVALSVTMIGAATAAPHPEVISLPNGFNPEGIASGPGTTFFVGSIATGAIYQGDFLTGTGEILVPGQEGRSATGLKYDPRSDLLFVSGGATGMVFIYNGVTGENVAEIQLATAQPSFINDVVITQEAAYFTESLQPVLYKVALDPQTGQLIEPVMVEVIPLTGDYEFVAGGFNANGIEATPNGDTLIIVNSTTGTLYSVDPATGVATAIDLGGASVPRGDGILLRGKTLYVVQNFLNQITVIKLSSDWTSGEITDVITSPNFRIPTTITIFGGALYAVNARFDTPLTPDTEYEVVRVPTR